MCEALGRPVKARVIPRAAWPAVLAQMGLGEASATNWTEMQDGFNSGRIDFDRPRAERVAGATSPAEIVKQKRNKLISRDFDTKV